MVSCMGEATHANCHQCGGESSWTAWVVGVKSCITHFGRLFWGKIVYNVLQL
jgi:hypothetical protein